MDEIKREILLSYPAIKMFKLVNDIEDYPKFIPACVSSKIISKDAKELIASLGFQKAGLSYSFTTKNSLGKINDDYSINLELVDGPLNYLSGYWKFKDLNGEGSKVSLELKFEIDNILLKNLFAPVIDKVADKLIAAFSQRADEVYGG